MAEHVVNKPTCNRFSLLIRDSISLCSFREINQIPNSIYLLPDLLLGRGPTAAIIWSGYPLSTFCSGALCFWLGFFLAAQ